jgi:hypothetical protein
MKSLRFLPRARLRFRPAPLAVLCIALSAPLAAPLAVAFAQPASDEASPSPEVASVPAVSAAAAIPVRPFPVQSDARKELAREYSRAHYGIDDWRLVDPRLIVVHYTGNDSDEWSLSAFKSDSLDASRTDIAAGGALNVGVQYVILKDGTVWSLLGETDMGRHAIGYNWTAIGIEMTGSAGSRLTEAQLESCAALIADIARRIHSIAYLCGHHEYVEKGRSHTVLYRELLTEFAPTVKSDPGPAFMAALRERLKTAYALELAD